MHAEKQLTFSLLLDISQIRSLWDHANKTYLSMKLYSVVQSFFSTTHVDFFRIVPTIDNLSPASFSETGNEVKKLSHVMLQPFPLICFQR